MEAVFWTSLALFAYTYLGYPIVLLTFKRIRSRPVNRAPVRPMVSIIIAAHNEEAGVRLKLENTLALLYPRELLEIILVSDGSTDRTVEVAVKFEAQGVRCVEVPEWVGKSVALNRVVPLARGEILVFTDIGAVAQPDCLEELVANFADPEIGCVSAQNHIVTQGSGGSEGAYMKYLMWLRRLESSIGSCTCVCGSFYAIRRELCPEFPAHAATDLLSVLETVKAGYRAVSEAGAHVSIGSVRTQKEEFHRKTRTVLLGVGCISAILPLLNPLRSGVFSIEIFSHKLLRWIGGIFLVSLLSTNVLVYGISDMYKVTLGAQGIIYGSALLGAMSERLAARSAAVRLAYFLVYTHISALLACWRYLTGKRVSVWQPSKREVRGTYT